MASFITSLTRGSSFRLPCLVMYNRICVKGQAASISSTRGLPRDTSEKPKPWNYRKKQFGSFTQFYDRTINRMDENSKVIVIDGPIGSGKDEFARRLAKQLDFKYVPLPSDDLLHNRVDRAYNSKEFFDLIPERCRDYLLQNFYEDPKPKYADGSGRVGQLILDWFNIKVLTYNDALLHLLSTGQGVVCVRSIYSDRVFAKALLENGYISKNAMRYYEDRESRDFIFNFPRPHLIIYLDADVDQTLENIKNQNHPLESKAQVLQDRDYHASIEREYKDQVLPSLEKHSHLLVYPSIPDITDHEVALMVEDIEALGPLEHSGLADDVKLFDWSYIKDEKLAYWRKSFASKHIEDFVVYRHEFPFEAPECYISPDIDSARQAVFKTINENIDNEKVPTNFLQYARENLLSPARLYYRPGDDVRRFFIPE